MLSHRSAINLAVPQYPARHTYDPVGRLANIFYPSSSTTVAATPDVHFSYNSAGRVWTRTEDGQATTTYEYTTWGTPKKETVVSSNTAALPSSVVERTFDGYGRPDLLKVQSGGATAPDVDYNFNGTTGLLGNVASDGRIITYGYNGVGPMPTSLTYAHSGTTLLSSSRPLNSAGLASGITDSQSGTIFQSLTYSYAADRVSAVTRNHEQTQWLYGYDQRGQVTSADKKFLYPSEYVRGLETDYTYDMTGNRTTKQQGGNGSYGGYSMRTTNYGTANALNQYTAITHPWSGASTWLDVSGQRSYPTETITVNSQEAEYQQAAYVPYYSFRKELLLTPTADQRYADVTINSSYYGVLDSGKMYVPPATENPVYDADGNLLQDSRWIYRWDAENRLVSQTPAISGPAAGVGTQTSIYHTYDGLARRVCRRSVQEVYQQTSPGVISLVGTYTFSRSFTYDGWNMVQSLDSGSAFGNFNDSGTAATRLSFVWGPDIGSHTHGHTSWQQAGGVGGLIAVLGTTATSCQLGCAKVG